MFQKQKSKIEQWIGKHEELSHILNSRLGRLSQIKNKISFAFVHPKILSFSGTVSYVVDWTKRLPSDYDVIIGVPRSGLWIANIIALRFGKPLSTPECFVKSEIWYTKKMKMDITKYKKILLVDDTVSTGKKIIDTLQQLKAFNPDLDISTAVFMVTNKGKKLVDYYYTTKEPPHLFEWNILSANVLLGSVSTDLDGVLCHDCPERPMMMAKNMSIG